MTAVRVAVIGGGIAGLAAAHRLVERAREGAVAVDVTLFEAQPRLGGTITTERVEGFTIETGPDAFITDKPWALALCRRMGIDGDLIGTAEGDRRTYIAHRGRLHPLPEGFLMLAPTNPWALAGSRLFSWRGKLRMALDLVLPARRDLPDESLASFVRRRLGQEALERVADPLVGGIYTADPEHLSLRATMPRFLDLEHTHGSVIRGLRAGTAARSPAEQQSAGARYSLFMSHRCGMGSLVEAIAARLPAGAIRVGTPVSALEAAAGWVVHAGTERATFDAVVLATPAPHAARLLERLDAPLAHELATIAYASSATVSLGYRAADLDLPPGFVVPEVEKRPLLACTFSSRKFPGRAPDGHELLRVFVGGARRPEPAELPDDALVDLVRRELEALLGVVAPPGLVRIGRWPRAMPQYGVGHLERVAAIDARVRMHPGLHLIGAAYRGVGIPDCVRAGEAAADAIVEQRSTPASGAA